MLFRRIAAGDSMKHKRSRISVHSRSLSEANDFTSAWRVQRIEKELEPLALTISENTELMQKLRGVAVSENLDLARHSNTWRRLSFFIPCLDHAVSIIFATLLFVCSISTCFAQVQDNNQQDPQFVWSTTKGLDYERNDIDRIIHIFGFGCDVVRHIPGYTPRPCGIERQLVVFLQKMPPSQIDISRRLIALGAICRMDKTELNCSYERRVEHTLWKADSPLPVAVMDNFFSINFVVYQVDTGLHYEAHFTRTMQDKLHKA
jgi:hypothetical protein